MTYRRLMSCCVFLFLIGVLLPIQKAAASASRQPLLAGGSLVVNDTTDADTRDGFLSLREAMKVANGAIGPFSPQERSQMTGCTFNAGGMITGGCGAGGDTILFASSLTQIILTSNLPQIGQDRVTINGAVNGGNIIINANAVVDYGFRVNANQVTLTNLTVINTSGFGNAIRLENNLWMGLQIYNNYLGVLPGSKSCSPADGITARPYVNILILGGSGTAEVGMGTAYIDNNVIGCSKNDGIAIADAPSVYIGSNPAGESAGNWIGVSRTGANIGNLGRGIAVCCSTIAIGNQVLGNHIAFNKLDGVIMQRVSEATVNNNVIFDNNGAGIYMVDASFVTLANNQAFRNDNSGIWLYQTLPIPLVTRENHILGGAYYQNGGAGISESPYADTNTWSQISTYGNMGLGIDKKDNRTPDLPPLTLDSISPAAQGVLVNGTLTGNILIGNTYHIELYRIAPDPGGSGEGRAYVGSADVLWNFAGNYHFSIPDRAGAGCYTAILTESTTTSSKTSSEFSTNLGTLCNQVYLPSIVR